VYIGPNVKVGAGCRVANSIILKNTVIHSRACVLYAILSEDSSVGQWTRVEGMEDSVAALSGGIDSRYQKFGICVFGASGRCTL
jgi:ADP-glucose pyrophosphorylase